MESLKEKPVIRKDNNLLIVEKIPTEYINSSHTLAIRLKDNYIQYDYLFKEYVDIQNERYTFDGGNFGYYECEIINSDNDIVFEENDTFIGKIKLIMDMNISTHTIRESCEIVGSDFQENLQLIVNKSEKTYFDNSDLQNRIDGIFKDFKANATKFVYIQDPYFDYNSYHDLIENLPSNLVVKVLCSKGKQRNIPNNHNLILIEDTKIDGAIHDRFIITESFGYYIGISLNGIHKNKSCVVKILNPTILECYFV